MLDQIEAQEQYFKKGLALFCPNMCPDRAILVARWDFAQSSGFL
jgi:hypothetical protein